MSDEHEELAGRINHILNEGPCNAEGLVFRDWKLPPYEGGPLHNPGKPGRDWSLFGSDPGPELVKVVQLSSLANEDELRAFIRAEVRAALEDDARELRENKAFQPISTHEHRRIEMTEESGKHWRGVLYRVNETPVEDEAATDPELPSVDVRVPSGICWACGGHGESAEMMWHERDRPHLIHNDPGCIKVAQIKPEIREHRG